MKKYIFSLLVAVGVAVASGEIISYQATAKTTPCVGYEGQVASVMFVSTNQTGTATLNAVTDLLVNGEVKSFTNTLATATLTNGIAFVTPTDTYVAPRQRIIVSGDAFPGGSATVWLKK